MLVSRDLPVSHLDLGIYVHGHAVHACTQDTCVLTTRRRHARVYTGYVRAAYMAALCTRVHGARACRLHGYRCTRAYGERTQQPFH